MLRRAGPEGREFLVSTRLEQVGRPLTDSIQVGSTSLRTLREYLGVPANEESIADTLRVIYPVPRLAAEEFLHFLFVQDVLRAVEWKFYVD